MSRMSFHKYHALEDGGKFHYLAKKYYALVDDGRRCISCCNRCNIFGTCDVENGWSGYCNMCNIRWRKAQLMSACRDMREMVLNTKLFGLNKGATELIFGFLCNAKLDIKFYREGVDFQRYLRNLTETWTSFVDSDVEVFTDDSTFSLSFLKRVCLTSVHVRREILKDLPSCRLSLLDVVATFLIKPSKSNYAGLTAYVQRHDYMLSSWKPLWQKGAVFLENEVTGERLTHAELQITWKRYKWRNAYWWLEMTPIHGRRCTKRWLWSKEIIRMELQRPSPGSERLPPWLHGQFAEVAPFMERWGLFSVHSGSWTDGNSFSVSL